MNTIAYSESGNTVVFKPSELTPLTALKLAEIFTEAGVFNVIHGDGSTGQLMTTHPQIAKISMTGEVSTGKKILKDAADTLKKVTLELGGKSPLIFFGDADLKNAVKAAMMANWYTQGEVCSNGTRVFVEESIKDEFLRELVKYTEKLKIGDPLDEQTQMGPLISKNHMEKVLSYIKSAKEEGGKILCGGDRYIPENPALAGGYFVKPTIVDNCRDDMKAVREEIFGNMKSKCTHTAGPVMTVLSFKTEEEIIRRANDTHYGLSAGVFTKDIQKAHRVIEQLQAGTCWINNYNITPIELPFGGHKQSGIGRENGTEAIEFYTQAKSVYVEMGDVQCPYVD